MQNNEFPTQKRDIRGFIIGLAVSLTINVLIAFVIGLIQVYSLNRDLQNNTLLILTDAFTMSGVLMCLYYLLVFVSNEGAFDILSYSLQLLWNVTFHKNVRETKLPSTYAEYRQMKRGKPHNSLLYILVSGLIFLIIGLIIMAFYYANL